MLFLDGYDQLKIEFCSNSNENIGFLIIDNPPVNSLSVDLIDNINDIIDCYINSINKMGILAYIKLNEIIPDYKGDNTFSNSPLIIIIPLQIIEDIDKESIGLEKKIKVKINAIRLKYNANKIQIIGEIIT